MRLRRRLIGSSMIPRKLYTRTCIAPHACASVSSPPDNVVDAHTTVREASGDGWNWWAADFSGPHVGSGEVL